MKSTWAYHNGKRIMRECLESKKIKTNFIYSSRFERNLYAEKGVVKTYSNITQADNKVAKLKEQGLKVERSRNWPYVLFIEIG